MEPALPAGERGVSFSFAALRQDTVAKAPVNYSAHIIQIRGKKFGKNGGRQGAGAQDKWADHVGLLRVDIQHGKPGQASLAPEPHRNCAGAGDGVGCAGGESRKGAGEPAA